MKTRDLIITPKDPVQKVLPCLATGHMADAHLIACFLSNYMLLCLNKSYAKAANHKKKKEKKRGKKRMMVMVTHFGANSGRQGSMSN